MKKLFTLIRQGKCDEIAAILDKKPELISCTAVAPPKKDNGQSPLMVAIKSDNLEAAHLLLDRGADVNFRDQPSEPDGESVPIWYFAVGQCFMRAGDIKDSRKERSKGYYELLCRLLDMGMDPNQKATSEFFCPNAWQFALSQYDHLALESYSGCNEDEDKAHNHQLQKMLRAVLTLLLAHKADIHDFSPPDKDGLPNTSVLLRNLEEGRELLDGFYGLDPEKLKPYTMNYRGKEHIVQPIPVEERYAMYQLKWRELEPFLRTCYEKAN